MSAAILESYLASNPDDATLFEASLNQLEDSDPAIAAQAVGTLHSITARAAVAPPVVGVLKLGDGKFAERIGQFLQSPMGQVISGFLTKWLASKLPA